MQWFNVWKPRRLMIKIKDIYFRPHQYPLLCSTILFKSNFLKLKSPRIWKHVLKFLSFQASLLAPRSPEGHAAKGMQIKGKEDLWIEIQAHTFRNWVNEHLRPLGHSVSDLSTDFCDGTRLLFLVEALQKRTLRGKVLKPQNQHQMLENVTRALDAVKEDGVKLVNIGKL